MVKRGRIRKFLRIPIQKVFGGVDYIPPPVHKAPPSNYIQPTEAPRQLDILKKGWVFANGNAVNATTTLYTVPVRKLFHLTNLMFHVQKLSAPVGDQSARITINAWGGSPFFVAVSTDANLFNDMATLSFPQDILLTEGTTVNIVTTGTSLRASGSVIGWEEDRVT